MSYREWWLDHPWRALAIFAGCGIIGGLLGLAAMLAAISLHGLSPDNQAAGAGIAFGSVVLGFIASIPAMRYAAGRWPAQ